MNACNTFDELGEALVARVGGNPIQASQRIMLSPTSPVWPETDGPAPTPRTVMRSFRRWVGCMPGTPGDKVLISGHLQARNEEISGTIRAADWPLFGSNPSESDTMAGDLEGQSTAMMFKIAVRRTGFPGWVLIDADSHVVMDAGAELEVHIIGPSQWLLFPTSAEGGEALPWLWTVIRVTACPLRCCWPPPGRLTLFGLMDPGAEPVDLTVVRPRRATALRVNAPPPGGAVLSFRQGNPGNTSSSFPTGDQSMSGGFVNTAIDPLGAHSHIVIEGLSGGPEFMHFDFEIT